MKLTWRDVAKKAGLKDFTAKYRLKKYLSGEITYEKMMRPISKLIVDGRKMTAKRLAAESGLSYDTAARRIRVAKEDGLEGEELKHYLYRPKGEYINGRGVCERREYEASGIYMLPPDDEEFRAYLALPRGERMMRDEVRWAKADKLKKPTEYDLKYGMGKNSNGDFKRW